MNLHPCFSILKQYAYTFNIFIGYNLWSVKFISFYLQMGTDTDLWQAAVVSL